MGVRGLEKKVNESSELVDLLRRAIMTGELKPRERLIETALAEKYHVSRTPVREAIKHLEALGLVKLERYKGAVVADVNTQEFREMQVVRVALEGLSAALAASRLEDEDMLRLEAFEKEMEYAAREGDIHQFSANNEYFHHLIYRGCGNHYLYETILNLLKKSWHEPCTSWTSLGDVPLVIRGHKKILTALKNRDPEKARVAAEQHIVDAIKLHDRLSQNEEPMVDTQIFRAF